MNLQNCQVISIFYFFWCTKIFHPIFFLVGTKKIYEPSTDVFRTAPGVWTGLRSFGRFCCTASFEPLDFSSLEVEPELLEEDSVLEYGINETKIMEETTRATTRKIEQTAKIPLGDMDFPLLEALGVLGVCVFVPSEFIWYRFFVNAFFE